jgi:hypothetical protein
MMPKKKKRGAKGNDNDDPLAFLQRAKQEKSNNANKKAMMEQEAAAAWKNKDEVSYNLLSKFMDKEDRWKKALGQDLYKDKANILAVDSSMR